MKTRILSLFLITLVFLGCRRGEEKSALTIWESYNDEEHEIFMKLVEEYEKQNPNVKIKVERIPFDAMEYKLVPALGTGTNPDIVRTDPAFTVTLAQKRSCVPIFKEEIQDLYDQLLEPALKSNILFDTLWGLPDQITLVMLFYRKDLFEVNGIKKPPETWEEFIQVAKRLTNPEKGIYGFAMHNSLWWTLPFIYSYGGDFITQDFKKCLLNSKESIEAFKLKVDLFRTYKVEAGAWQQGAINPEMGFMDGKYAMIFSGPWNIKIFEKSRIPFGIAPIPKGPKGSISVTGGTNMVILNPQKKAEALKFLKFLLSEENQAFWSNTLGQIPVNIKSFSLVDTLKNPYMGTLLDAVKRAKARPPFPYYRFIEEIANQEMELALKGVKTPEQAMADAANRIEKEVLTLFK